MLTYRTLPHNKFLNKAYGKEKVSRAAVDRLKQELPLLLPRQAGGYGLL